MPGLARTNTSTIVDTNGGFAGSAGTGSIWSSWNTLYRVSSYATTSATYTITSANVWSGWNNNSNLTPSTCSIGINAIGGYTTSDSVWSGWNGQWSPTMAQVHRLPAQPRREETAEERTRRETQEAEWRRKDEERRLESDSAARRARELLLSLLSEEQKRDWVASAGFYLHVGDKKYRIKKGRSGNVELVDPNTHEPLERYCAHPVDNVPDEDTVVAQMMMLLHAERDFIALANTHRRKPGFRRPDGLQSATDRSTYSGQPTAFDPHHVQQMRRAA